MSRLLSAESTGVAPQHAQDGAGLRIASVCIHYPSAADPVRGVFVQRRLEALSRIAQVRVISPRPWFPWLCPRVPVVVDGRESPPVDRPPMFYVPRFLKRLDGYWLMRVLLPCLKRMLAEGGVDLVDAHFEYPEAVGAVGAARALRLPVFVTLRGLLPKYAAMPAYRRRILAALRQATGLITVSESLRKMLISMGITRDRIAVIPNAVDARTFALRPHDQARRLLGIDRTEQLIVSVGHVVPVKGFRDLVDALILVRRASPTARLVVIGSTAVDPAYCRQLHARLRAAGLGDACRLLGQQPSAAIATWLAAADVFALASRSEGCCNAVLEALAMGLPVVGTPVGDNARYVVDGHNGILVPVGDVTALAMAIRSALARPWDREAISREQTARDWGHVAEEVVAFIADRTKTQAGSSPGT